MDLRIEFSWQNFLRFVHYIARTSDQGYLGMCSESSLLGRMLRMHSFQPCRQFTIVLIVQSTRWDVANFGTAWSDIIYGT